MRKSELGCMVLLATNPSTDGLFHPDYLTLSPEAGDAHSKLVLGTRLRL